MATTPISTTDPRSAEGNGGFTLLELLVVLAIIAVVAAISTPMVSMPGVLGPDRKAARDLQAGLLRARALAIRENRETAFTLDVERRRFGVDGRTDRALPETMKVTLTTAQSEIVGEAVGSIRFFPDGSSTGGRITLASAADEERGREPITVRIRWLTGHVAIEP